MLGTTDYGVPVLGPQHRSPHCAAGNALVRKAMGEELSAWSPPDGSLGLLACLSEIFLLAACFRFQPRALRRLKVSWPRAELLIPGRAWLCVYISLCFGQPTLQSAGHMTARRGSTTCTSSPHPQVITPCPPLRPPKGGLGFVLSTPCPIPPHRGGAALGTTLLSSQAVHCRTHRATLSALPLFGFGNWGFCFHSWPLFTFLVSWLSPSVAHRVAVSSE